MYDVYNMYNTYMYNITTGIAQLNALSCDKRALGTKEGKRNKMYCEEPNWGIWV